VVSTILADTVVSVSDLKKNPIKVVEQGEGFPIAVLNRNHPAFYCVPAEAYEALMDKLEDLELNALADARANQERIAISLDDL
jgi:antitoxin StbD